MVPQIRIRYAVLAKSDQMKNAIACLLRVVWGMRIPGIPRAFVAQFEANNTGEVQCYRNGFSSPSTDVVYSFVVR
jgi:hypothetical protein